jgi:hypothetical protein
MCGCVLQWAFDRLLEFAWQWSIKFTVTPGCKTQAPARANPNDEFPNDEIPARREMTNVEG